MTGASVTRCKKSESVNLLSSTCLASLQCSHSTICNSDSLAQAISMCLVDIRTVCIRDSLESFLHLLSPGPELLHLPGEGGVPPVPGLPPLPVLPVEPRPAGVHPPLLLPVQLHHVVRCNTRGVNAYGECKSHGNVLLRLTGTSLKSVNDCLLSNTQ